MHKISTRMVCVNGKHPRFSGSASTVTFILTCPEGKSQYVIFYLLNPLQRSVSDLEQAKCDNCSSKGQQGIHPQFFQTQSLQCCNFRKQTMQRKKGKFSLVWLNLPVAALLFLQ